MSEIEEEHDEQLDEMAKKEKTAENQPAHQYCVLSDHTGSADRLYRPSFDELLTEKSEQRGYSAASGI